MIRLLKKIYQCIVGEPYGFDGEGNSQWYFFLSLVIINMLTWTFRPELGVVFTVLSVLCFAFVSYYGTEMLGDELSWKNKSIAYRWAIFYVVFHLAIAVACLILNWQWTLLMAAIVMVAMMLAPDDGGCNFFIRELNADHTLSSMVFHTILFAAFVVATCLLPVAFWIKLIIIAACMIAHPFIDYGEGDCMSIESAFDDTVNTLCHMFHKNS